MDLSKHKILYSPKEGTSGFWGLINYPEKPSEYDFGNTKREGFRITEFFRAEEKYEKALESCKENKLEIVNAEEVLKGFDVNRVAFFMDKCLWSQLPNHYTNIFDLPEGYEFKEEYIDGSCGHPCDDYKDECQFNGCKHQGDVKVLRLVKTETFKERFTKLFPQPETKDFEWKDDMKLFDYDRLNLRQTIITAMQDWVNQNERESIPRRGFNDFADKLTDTIQRKKQ